MRLHTDSQLWELCLSTFLYIFQVHKYSCKSVPFLIIVNNAVSVILVAWESLQKG